MQVEGHWRLPRGARTDNQEGDRPFLQAGTWAEKQWVSLAHQRQSGFKSGKLESSRFGGQNGVYLAHRNHQSKCFADRQFSSADSSIRLSGKWMLDRAAKVWRQLGPAERAGRCLWHTHLHNPAARY